MPHIPQAVPGRVQLRLPPHKGCWLLSTATGPGPSHWEMAQAGCTFRVCDFGLLTWPVSQQSEKRAKRLSDTAHLDRAEFLYGRQETLVLKSNQVNPRGCSGGSEFLSQMSGTVVGTAEEMVLDRPFFRRPENQRVDRPCGR